MRPVNLIPPEERRGSGAPSRTGRAPYAVLALLALMVGAFALYVGTSSSISNREAEITALEQAERDAQAKADALRPFATFAAARQTRETTIASLARSRFDWERVMSELARVIPSDVWLSELTATVSQDTTLAGGSGISLRSDVTGPALEIVGCGRSHEAVAGMITALEDIDGVTRVTALNSSRQGAEGAGSGGAGADCQTRPSVASFQLVAAFDEVPAPEIASAPAGGVAPAAATATSAPAGSVPATESSPATPISEATP